MHGWIPIKFLFAKADGKPYLADPTLHHMLQLKGLKKKDIFGLLLVKNCLQCRRPQAFIPGLGRDAGEGID